MHIHRFILLAFVPFTIAFGGGKHLEIMAPMCQQSDFKGRPHHVFERCFESSESEASHLVSTARKEYDPDGNALRLEEFDASNKKTDSEVYQYDADGTWVFLIEQTEASFPKTFQIFLDLASRRIAHVEAKSKQTEFYTYTEQGFELGTSTKSSTGKIIEQTSFRRNISNKEERVIFEEPAGNKTTEILIEWSEKGFEKQSTMIMHDRGGDRIVSTFEYPEVDAVGNWLTCVKKRELHQSNGEKVPMATETLKREIRYHP